MHSTRLAWALLAAIAVGVVAFGWVAYRAVSDPLGGAFAIALGDSNPAWAPDGTRIAFQRDVEGEANQIYVVDADGGDAKKLTTENLDNQDPAWSPDGKRIVFVGADELHLVRSDGSDAMRLGSVFGVCCPAWSPDGKHIAFQLSRARGGDLYVMRVDGSGLRRLTRSAGFEASPAWSPDGKTIAYDGPSGGIYLIRSDGTGARRLTSIGREPAWAPDGNSLVASSTQGLSGGGLSVIDVRGKLLASLVPDVIASNPAWSPDGREIVFDGGGSGVLYIVNADGSSLHQLTGD